MTSPLSRRSAIKSLAAASTVASSTVAGATVGSPTVGSATVAGSAASQVVPLGIGGVNLFESRWETCNDRVWLGREFWANPMEDWRIIDGAAECITGGGDRNIQLLTHQLTNTECEFVMSVDIQQVETQKKDGGAGFRIGLKSELNEYRSNCFAKGGWLAGIAKGKLVLGQKKIALPGSKDKFRLKLTGIPLVDQFRLTLQALDGDGQALAELSVDLDKEAVTGNVALVSNFDRKLKNGEGARYRFQHWQVAGDAFTVSQNHTFGPILWTMYSLSDSRSDDGFVMKMSALTPPLGENDSQTVELQVDRAGVWKSLGHATLDTDAWVATFRVIKWDESKDQKYRVVYQEKSIGGKSKPFHWDGTIKANPTGRPLRLGALTCQKDYGFPYQPVNENLLRLDPDMLYFSGDQIYENHGGYGLIRSPAEPAILNYLRKFYMFGLSFADSMKDRPTVCIPDDHDVFQGNLWGENGIAMDVKTSGASSNGGYIEPARMVNAVHKTCVAHHPDYFDPTPCEQDISVYYGDMVYGDVSFAILGDRQFKSGPQHVDTGKGRADHVTDPDVDMSRLDIDGLELLGARQEKFLEEWVDDWRGHSMKVLLSQTVFAGVATHHGGYNSYLRADLDCGSWPQTPRNNAVRILRKGMPLHVNGDQHMTSLVQYGVDEQRDGCWSFCTPAIAAGYPRWWRPDEVNISHENRPSHGLPNTGEYLDSFGNKAYVYAVGNPEVGKAPNRYDQAHEKGSGFGMVTIDTEAKTYKLEAFRFLCDATANNPEDQFPGWPVTIHQKENSGNNLIS